MLKAMLRYLPILLLLLIPSSSKGTTFTAADCQGPTLQALVNGAVDGDTIVLPACSQTNFTTTVTVTHCIEIKGQGAGVTILGDNVTKNGSGSTSQLITFSGSCLGAAIYSPHDFTIVGVAPDPSIFNKGHLAILGSGSSTGGFRVYNITGTGMQTSFASINWVGHGLFDHNNFPNCGGAKAEINIKASSWGGAQNGDGSWSDTSPIPGSSNMIIIEQNTWTCSGAAPSQVVDGDAGARWTFRFNTVTGGNMVNHGTDTSQRERSGRWQEYYKNTLTFPSNQTPPFLTWFRGGSGLQWGNNATAPGGLNNLSQLTVCRSSGNPCGGSPFPPWGICDGTGTYDQNSPGLVGYRCVDQAGAGTSNVVSGSPPSPLAWVGNALLPIYFFLNTGTNPSFNFNAGGQVQQDRDYYSDRAGSQGVRNGTFANIPATCTLNQAYWAIDQGFWNNLTGVASGQLYKCGSSNNWTLYCTPYTFPDPLQGGSIPPPPSPPPLGISGSGLASGSGIVKNP